MNYFYKFFFSFYYDLGRHSLVPDGQRLLELGVADRADFVKAKVQSAFLTTQTLE